jgi:hypothetical protein
VPTLELQPQEDLIGEIQDQVAAVTARYAEGLIRSVQANFRDSRLTVTTSNGWYGLPTDQQDQLAADLFQRAQELDFTKLEIADPEATIVARSPVVGNQMIILQRQAPETTMVVE